MLVCGCSLPQAIVRSSNALPEFTSTAGAWRELDVPMRDGVKLHTHVLMPNGLERAPVVLMRNPYPRDILFKFSCSVFAHYGIGCVVQDVRGQRESEGEWSPLVNEVADLYRRMSNILSFTRPGGQRAAAEETAGENAGSGGDGAHTSPGDPGVDPAPS